MFGLKVNRSQCDKADMPYGILQTCGDTSWYCCFCQDEEKAVVIARALQAWYDNDGEGDEALGDDYDTHHKNFEVVSYPAAYEPSLSCWDRERT